MVLEHVNRLQRPIVSREMEIAVHIAAIFPIRRKPAHPFINRALLDPKARITPQLQIERILHARDFMRPVSESNFNDMQSDVRTRLHMNPEIMERFSATLPSIRIRIHRNDMQLLRLRILHELAMNIWVLEDHSHSPRSFLLRHPDPERSRKGRTSASRRKSHTP